MSRKRALEPDLGGGGLYDFLPQPDPAKEAAALAAAESKAAAKLPEEDKSRVIFLDVDGVLLPAGSTEMIMVDGELVATMSEESDFRSAALRNLRKIIEHTGASIVLSSEWRRTEGRRDSLGMAFRSNDIPQVKDSTPMNLKVRQELLRGDNAIAWCERRAREIADWLRRHPHVKAWVALDDVDFNWADSVRSKGTPIIKCRSVRTDAEKCLSEDDAEEAIRILKNPVVLTPEQEAGLERRAKRKTEAAIAAAKAADKERRKAAAAA